MATSSQQANELPEASEVEQTADGSAISLQLLSEGNSQPVMYTASSELGYLLVKAARINHHYETNFDISFSSILLAFLTVDDPLSNWFKEYVEQAGVAVDQLLSTRRLTREVLANIAAEPASARDLLTPFRQTVSVRSLFAAALEFNNTFTPNLPLDVRHVMAAYIYRPVGHEGDLVNLNYNRPAWSNAFLNQVARLYPAELTFWLQLHSQTFPSTPALVGDNGLSTHIASDLWTREDSLGYRNYAYAISRFVTHPLTKPPLTISIQAQWGGGKTSLMRMIQHDLDPAAFNDVKLDQTKRRGAITIKTVLNEVNSWIEKKTQKDLPQTPDLEERQLLTVWFNAWKYENSNQVWAGLADAIMQQVAARLTLAERELFWLRLNFKRVDADKIRQKIYDRVFRYWWRAMQKWLFPLLIAFLGSLLVALAGGLGLLNGLETAGEIGAGLSVTGAIIMAVVNYLKSKSEVDKEPAAVSLGELLDIPNYKAELGFVHSVEADLRKVLNSVPQKNQPIVIFIDDLDRCSPAKVGQVMEAVNLFLAGELPNCFFILGMDSEMVAAALQATHKDIVANLPDDAAIPVGWRFMDKFVQLPFLIPPAQEKDLENFTTSLFSADKGQVNDPEVERLAAEAASNLLNRNDIPGQLIQLQQQHQLDAARLDNLKNRLEAQVERRSLDLGIAQFNDRNPEIRKVIGTAKVYFRGNPRELKRFINVFRFHYFLWWAQRARGVESPGMDQLVRWTVLCMRWPEVIRWLRRGGGSDWQILPGQTEPTLSSRLKLFEEVSGNACDLASWQKLAGERLQLAADKTSWLKDDDLLQFLYHEYKSFPEGQRLSDGLGRGLW